jgi:hypothetical protein
MPLTTHIDEDVLELYSLGRLAETQSSGLEEHLLICRACQERLEQTDDFVRAFRMAVRGKPQPEKRVAHRRRWWNWAGAGWQPIPVGAALALVAMGVIALAPRSVPTEEIEVRLSALRGSGSGALATVPAQRMLRLNLDAQALPGQSYRIELADARGRQLWQSLSPVRVESESLHTTVARLVPAGLYWVRLYDPISGQLAREYGLNVR